MQTTTVMQMRLLLIVSAGLALGACQPLQILSATEDHVVIEARGTFALNPGPLASEKCAKYGKEAVLVAAHPPVYEYRCR